MFCHCSIIFIVFFASAIFSYTAPNPHDSILVSYKLTPEQERASTYGENPFWKTIQDKGLDSIYLIPSLNSSLSSVFTNDQDAQIVIYSAYGDSGIYFYFEAEDDRWDDIPNWDFSPITCDYKGCTNPDEIEFALDRYSSEYMYSHPSSFYLRSSDSNNSFTKTTINYQMMIGTGITDPPYFVDITNLNPAWDSMSSSHTAQASLQLKEFYFHENGLQIDEWADSSLPNWRVSEWFIPWNKFSNKGITMPDIGDKKAAIFGYKDSDNPGPLCYPCYKELWWRKGGPFGGAPDNRPWGDIEFGPYLDSVPANGVINRIPTQRGFKPYGTELYNLLGRKVSNISPAGHSVIIERGIDASGNVMVRKKLIVR